MTCYYAVPVRRENRTLIYNPVDGQCSISVTPHDALVGLGMPEDGSMFAVWPLNRKVGIQEAGRVCSLMAPLRIYIVIDGSEGVILPIGLEAMHDAVMEVPDADRD